LTFNGASSLELEAWFGMMSKTLALLAVGKEALALHCGKKSI
jgi:hypothetical protein